MHDPPRSSSFFVGHYAACFKKKLDQVTKTIVNSHGSKVKSFFLLPGTDQTVLREARGVEVAPLKVKIVIIVDVG